MDTKHILNKVQGHKPIILGSEEYTKSAVLLPIIQKSDGLHILFEVRSQHLRRQPGEICFPGGRIDQEDSTEQAAAIRETKEELGLKDQDITNVFPINYLVSPFGMMVYPFVGFIQEPDAVNSNPQEVGEVFTVPLSFFLQTKPDIHHVYINIEPDEKFPFDLIVGGENYNWRTGKIDEYFYLYEDRVIWGLTARILADFINMIQS
ncbi:NUDIX hydrolase [Salinibacillus xinjiangensis]|uniref:NUDIX domain-containing protein n=1 Tax=Salinibacillus xinjiangensis TaxID=1229268 RepID=A0A6G1XAC7_9BACI|nr:CoA pyrophosphatase [Salinibacillus xinjiangensis]MRG87856.1 NUDIX domain-containing protein [Salinibacillus xinjiangensis]